MHKKKEFLIGQSSRSYATYRRPSLGGFYFTLLDVNFVSVDISDTIRSSRGQCTGVVGYEIETYIYEKSVGIK